MAQDYWRGGWANQTEMLPGTRAAAMDKGRYGPYNALADIIGAVIRRNEQRAYNKKFAEANMELLSNPIDVNTNETYSTADFGNPSLNPSVGNQQQGISLIPEGGFGTDEWIQRQQAPTAQALPPAMGNNAIVQQPKQMTAEEVEYQKNLQEHPEWFDLDGNYIGNTFTMHDGVSDSNLDPLTQRKLNLLSRDFRDTWGEPLGATSMRRHGDGSSWHDSGQAFDVAGGILETNPEERAWAVNQAAKYGLVPLDEYANPSPHATGGHLHFSDHGDALTNNYEQAGGAPTQSQNSIQMAPNSTYAPPEKQLHKATAEQPWTDHYNSWEHVKSVFEDKWAQKMKRIVDKFPEILQDKDFMTRLIQSRNDTLEDLQERWGKTETNANWDKFMRTKDPKEKLFFAVKAGLDSNGVKMLMSPDWSNELIDLHGKKAMMQVNKFTGEWLINGHAPTEGDLVDVMTPSEKDASNRGWAAHELNREKFEYQKEHDAERDAVADKRWELKNSSAGRSNSVSSKPKTNSEVRSIKARITANKQQMEFIAKSKYRGDADRAMRRDAEYQRLAEETETLMRNVGELMRNGAE